VRAQVKRPRRRRPTAIPRRRDKFRDPSLCMVW